LIPIVMTAAAATGAYLLVTRFLFGWRDLHPPRATGSGLRRRAATALRVWMTQAGLDTMRTRDLVVVVTGTFMIGAIAAMAFFGALLPAVVVGGFAATAPLAVAGRRRRTRREVAHDAWPRLIEELRMLTSSLGRSLPQALFEAGCAAPGEMQPAFEAAQREWLISTDFPRTIGVLKEQLADATADAVCETLLIAHELGGSDVDRRLGDLADDRREDVRYRRDARAQQAGVRFARRFVLIVPLGMALAGMSVGDGRVAYATASGQLAVVVALAMVAACWIWAGRLMRLPDEDRVFDAR
jgi:tight adherence protein B